VSARAWLLFLSVAVLWGIPYLFIKIAVDELDPVTIVLARALIGAAVMLPVAARLGAFTDLRGRWGWLVALAVLDFVLPFMLITTGEKEISSSLAGVLVASVPLLIALLAIRFDHSERVTGWRLLGLFIGLGGVVLLLGLEVSGDAGALAGSGMVLLASLSYAASTLVYKRGLADLRPVGVVCASLGISSAVLIVPALVVGVDSAPSADTIASLLVLGVLSTAGGFLTFYALMSEVGAGRAAVVTYVSPIVSVAAGVAVLGEPVTAAVVAGMLLIIAGSWLSTGGGVPPGALRVSRYSSRSRDSAASDSGVATFWGRFQLR
jgi:drug/metabolite transporter (DMT)-like permease